MSNTTTAVTLNATQQAALVKISKCNPADDTTRPTTQAAGVPEARPVALPAPTGPTTQGTGVPEARPVVAKGQPS